MWQPAGGSRVAHLQNNPRTSNLQNNNSTSHVSLFLSGIIIIPDHNNPPFAVRQPGEYGADGAYKNKNFYKNRKLAAT